MAKTIDSQVGFTGGLFSPLLDSRVDLPKYRNACRQLKNMIVLKQGGVTRRPGTQFVAQAKYVSTVGHNFAVNLFEFQFSPDTSFVLEFGHLYVRFYSNGVPVVVVGAPFWLSSSGVYHVSDYVRDAADSNNTYRCILAISFSSTAPHLDPTHWVKQSIYEIASPYTADTTTNPTFSADVFGLTNCQVNDVVYLAHPSYPPYKLQRVTDTSWTLTQVQFITPPLLDQNITNTTIAPSATSGSVSLTATAPAWVTSTFYQIGSSVLQTSVIYNCIVPHIAGTFATDLASGYWVVSTIFQSGHVGSYWQLAALRSSAYVEFDITGAGSSSTIEVLGDWEVHTYGVWSADVEVQTSLDGGTTWSGVRQFTGRSDRNVDLTGTSVNVALFKLVVTNYAAPVNPGATTPRVIFESVDAFLRGVVKVTAVSSAYAATATVITPLYSTTGTQYWSEGAWSAVRGYPRAVTSYQQRMIYGGSSFEPQRVWGTQTGDIENFDLSDQTKATDAFAFDIDARGRGPIQWLVAQTDLFIGFSGAEWVVNSGSSSQTGAAGSAIGPTSFNASEHSSWGSAVGVQPSIVGNAVLYTQRQGKTIQQMLFSIYTTKYMSSDMTSLSEQLFSPGVQRIRLQPQFRNQSILWSVNRGGGLAGMTYQLEQEVFGWHQHVTGDTADLDNITDLGFESVAVLEGKNSSGSFVNDDEVWVVVNRTTGNGPVRMIERINPLNWEVAGTSASGISQPDITQAFYVDCGTTVQAPDSNTIPGFSYLEGRKVVGTINGNVTFGPIPVASGQITIPNYSPIAGFNNDILQVGLPIDYRVQPMRLDLDARSGIIQGLTKALSDVYVRIVNTAGGNVIDGYGNSSPLIQKPVSLGLGTTPQDLVGQPLTTNELRVQPFSEVNRDPIVIIQGRDALPLTLLAIIVKFSVTGQP